MRKSQESVTFNQFLKTEKTIRLCCNNPVKSVKQITNFLIILH